MLGCSADTFMNASAAIVNVLQQGHSAFHSVHTMVRCLDLDGRACAVEKRLLRHLSDITSCCSGSPTIQRGYRATVWRACLRPISCRGGSEHRMLIHGNIDGFRLYNHWQGIAPPRPAAFHAQPQRGNRCWKARRVISICLRGVPTHRI